MAIEIKGAKKVRKEFENIKNISYAEFIDFISRQTLSLLTQNTPVDTGELRDSWKVLEKRDDYVGIGTEVDQLPKLNALIFGTRYMEGIDFLSPIVEIMQDNINSIMRRHLKTKHVYLKNIKQGRQSIETPSNIVGLTGLSFAKRRGRGKSVIKRTTLNRPSLRPKIYRRRKV